MYNKIPTDVSIFFCLVLSKKKGGTWKGNILKC